MKHIAPAFLALACALPATASWTYDPSARTLTQGAIVLQNVSASGTKLMIGDNKSNATATDLDFSTGVDGGYTITQIANNAFDQNKNVTNLVLPDTLTYIGQSAFYACSNFKGELVLPDSLTSTGYHPFAETGITRLEFGSGMATVNNWFVRNNQSLRSVKWNDAITAINSQAFQSDSGITIFENDFPTNVTSIANNAFDGALALTGDHAVIRLPKITSFGSCAFQAADFEGVEIGGTLGKLTNAQFYGSKIRWAIVDDGVTEIGYNSFAECTSLTNLVFPATLQIAGPALKQNMNGSQTMHVWWNSIPSSIDTSVNGFITAKGSTVDHLDWNDKAAWEEYASAWTGDSRQQLTVPPSPFGEGKWGWAQSHKVYWHNQPIAEVGGIQYARLADAIAAANGAPIAILPDSLAQWTQERVALGRDEGFAILDDGHVLGYEPSVDPAGGWKLAVSHKTLNGDPAVVYKAVGPGLLILLK